MFAYGFVLRRCEALLRTGMERQTPWNRPLELLKNGFFATLLSIIYLLPALALGVALLIGVRSFASLSAGLTLSVGIVLVLFIAAWYFIPAAVLRFVASGRVGDGLEFARVAHTCLNVVYARYWLVAFVFSLLVSAVIYLLSLLATTVFGEAVIGSIAIAIIGAALGFYQLLVIYTFMTRSLLEINERRPYW